MPINQTIARLSDLSFQSAFAVYLLALVLLIWHYAATRTDHVHRFELGSRKLVAAGGVSAPSPEVPGRIVSAPPKPVPERLGNMGAAVLVVGLGLHLVSIVLRGFATGRFPLGNMYEFVTMAHRGRNGDWHRVSAWADIPRDVGFSSGAGPNPDVRCGQPCSTPTQRLSFRLCSPTGFRSMSQSYSIGSGVFPGFRRGQPSRFLLRIRQPAGAERRGPVGSMARRLPDAQTLDRLAYRTVIVGFSSLWYRSHPRRDLGGGSLGSVLGVGSQRDDVVYRLGDLRRLPPRPPSDRRLARDQSRLDKHRRIRLDAVQSVHHQHGRVRIALPTPV